MKRIRAGALTRDRRPLSFRWNGATLTAFHGDTLAAGLLANDVKVVGTSVSLGRPRGVMSAGWEEAHAFAQLGDGPTSEPLMRATTVELFDGLTARGRITKGRLSGGADPERFDRRFAHCDVLVVGGGPAGLAAARVAASGGARVILAESRAAWGGALRRDRETIDGAPALAWVDQVLRELASRPEVTLLGRTSALFSLDQNGIVLVERIADHLPPARRGAGPVRRLWKVRAGEVIIATGSLERPVVFPDNDRPGVMLAGAVRSYLLDHGLAPERAAIFTTNDDAYRTAFDLSAAGVPVRVLDARADAGPVATRARAAGIEVITETAVIGTVAGPDGALTAVRYRAAAGVAEFECDVLGVSGGFDPLVDLHVQRRDPTHRLIGAAAESWSLAACLRDGTEAGEAAARAVGFPAESHAVPAAGPGWDGAAPMVLWQVAAPDGDESRSFVDLHRDVTVAGIGRAVGAGIRSAEHVKRYTLAGTGVEQGKSAKAAAGAIAGARLDPARPLGTSSGRPPTEPVAFAALAGRFRGDLFDPIRTTPAHPAHVALGAVFENVGQWNRPRYFPRGSESLAESARREVTAVRTGVGIMDASTLGKIDVQGPDAATFLDRLYVNRISSLKVGRARYASMCRLDGSLFDDGVVMRVGADRFFVTTSTSHAGPVMEWMEEWRQTEWPDLDVGLTSITEQWATYAVAGPRAREVVGAVAPGTDVGREAFPFLAVAPAVIAGVAGQIARVSFSGELAFEVSVPGTAGLATWSALMAAGAAHGITPYGLEALSVLRAEKGFIIVGQDTDTDTSPVDAGLGWMISDKDFVGRRSLSIAAHRRPDRRRLIGVLPSDPDVVVPEGAQLVEDPAEPRPMTMIGHVTTSHFSPTIGRSFGLALVRRGPERIGQTVYAPLGDRVVAMEIVDPVFYDKAGARRDG